MAIMSRIHSEWSLLDGEMLCLTLVCMYANEEGFFFSSSSSTYGIIISNASLVELRLVGSVGRVSRSLEIEKTVLLAYIYICIYIYMYKYIYILTSHL